MNNSAEACVADSADARRLVDSLKAAGADMLNPRAVSQAMYYVIAAEARRIGIPFAAHTDENQISDHIAENPTEIADSGASVLDYTEYWGWVTDYLGKRGLAGICWWGGMVGGPIRRACEPAAKQFQQRGAWFVPALVSQGGANAATAQVIAMRFRARAREFWAGASRRGNWFDGTPVDSLGAMYAMGLAGLPILAGTDVGAPRLREQPPGFALHAELAMYVAEGLTPLTALQSATLNPAKMLRATDSLGTVAPGKLADLVLLDANPLANITNTMLIRAVVANGRYYDRAALDQLLAKARAANKGTP